MKSVLGIFDTVPGYGQRLAAFLSRQAALPFETVVFSELSAVQAFLDSSSIHVMLVGERSMCSQLEHMGISQLVLLSEVPVSRENEGIFCLYRYQAADQLALALKTQFEILEAAAGSGKSSSLDFDIYAVYSPVKRCGKTSFSLALARALNERYRTLYLNLEEFSWVSELLFGGASFDLSDAIYFFEERELPVRLPQLLQEYEGLEYILPVRCPADIRKITGEKLVKLLQEIGSCSQYHTFVVDAGDALMDIRPLLQRSKTVFMPMQEDDMSRYRTEQFYRYLQMTGYEEAAARIYELKIPRQSGGKWGREFLEQIFRGEMANVVKELSPALL